MTQTSATQTEPKPSALSILFLSFFGALRMLLSEIGLFIFHTIKATIWLACLVFKIAKSVSEAADEVGSGSSASSSSSSSSSSRGSAKLPPIASIKDNSVAGYVECYDISGRLYKKIYIAGEFHWAAVKSDLIAVCKEDGTFDIYDLYGHYVENRRNCP